MKIFWKVLGLKKALYTGKAVEYITDIKTGKKYYVGEGRYYKAKSYPKELAESIYPAQYNFYYGVSLEGQPDRIEKKGCGGKTRKIYEKVSPFLKEKEDIGIQGFWKVEGLNVYTACAADCIVEKKTGKEYRRGKMELFSDENEYPFPLAEHTDLYAYILEAPSSSIFSTEERLREIDTAIAINMLLGSKK